MRSIADSKAQSTTKGPRVMIPMKSGVFGQAIFNVIYFVITEP